MAYLMTTYHPLPITIARGEGIYVWDTDGNKYLDAISGVAVCSLGHCHPKVTKAIQQQATTLVHCSNLFTHVHQEELAKKLVELSGLENAFFANSGAEANEAALKLTRLYARQRNIAHPKIIVMEKAFHGRTFATLSASNKKIQLGFEPLLEGFICVPYNDIDAVKEMAKQHKDVVAIMVEPIQGEAGVRVPDNNYLEGLREICDANKWLLIFDEIQGGVGRSGKWFSFQHSNIKPDIITLAKALANGVPIGACIAGKAAHDLFKPGSHGSTFGGNPLATNAALAVINTIENENILENVKQRGEELLLHLKSGLVTVPFVKAIRGKGLWIGIELTHSAQPLLKQAAEKGLLINIVHDNTIRLAPPLIINVEQTEFIARTIVELVSLLDR